MEYNLKRYLAFQYNELKEHTYFMSEKAGYDVGINNALIDWVTPNTTGFNHSDRFRQAYLNHKDSIESVCNDKCGRNNCKGLNHCDLTTSLVHILLEDIDPDKVK